jgi:hypothetical protein
MINASYKMLQWVAQYCNSSNLLLSIPLYSISYSVTGIITIWYVLKDPYIKGKTTVQL